jgi:hypothetical protein
MPGESAGATSRAVEAISNHKPEAATGTAVVTAGANPEATQTVTEPVAAEVSQTAGTAVSPEIVLAFGLVFLFVALVALDR